MQTNFDVDSIEVLRKTEELVSSFFNRYALTLQVVHKAKEQKHLDRYDDILNDDSVKIKFVVRAILKMAAEINFTDDTNK